VAGHDDLIAPAVTPELATAALTVQALTWKRGGTQGLDASLDEHLADARRSLETARTRHPIWTPRRVGRLLTVGGSR
jgi:hypothetical protein